MKFAVWLLGALIAFPASAVIRECKEGPRTFQDKGCKPAEGAEIQRPRATVPGSPAQSSVPPPAVAVPAAATVSDPAATGPAIATRINISGREIVVPDLPGFFALDRGYNDLWRTVESVEVEPLAGLIAIEDKVALETGKLQHSGDAHGVVFLTVLRRNKPLIADPGIFQRQRERFYQGLEFAGADLDLAGLRNHLQQRSGAGVLRGRFDAIPLYRGTTEFHILDANRQAVSATGEMVLANRELQMTYLRRVTSDADIQRHEAILQDWVRRLIEANPSTSSELTYVQGLWSYDRKYFYAVAGVLMLLLLVLLIRYLRPRKMTVKGV